MRDLPISPIKRVAVERYELLAIPCQSQLYITIFVLDTLRYCFRSTGADCSLSLRCCNSHYREIPECGADLGARGTQEHGCLGLCAGDTTYTTRLISSSAFLTLVQFSKPRFDTILRDLYERTKQTKPLITYIGRKPSASPATGSYKTHGLEQQELIDKVFEK